MSYLVKTFHHKPAYIKGDLEEETVMIDAKVYNTRKEAKEFIENKLRGKKQVYRNYHKGDKQSTCGYYTGKTWINENTGEECEESFTYIMSKA